MNLPIFLSMLYVNCICNRIYVSCSCYGFITFNFFQALGTGFSQFAEPVFKRCINIIQSQQFAKVLATLTFILFIKLVHMLSLKNSHFYLLALYKLLLAVFSFIYLLLLLVFNLTLSTKSKLPWSVQCFWHFPSN